MNWLEHLRDRSIFIVETKSPKNEANAKRLATFFSNSHVSLINTLPENIELLCQSDNAPLLFIHAIEFGDQKAIEQIIALYKLNDLMVVAWSEMTMTDEKIAALDRFRQAGIPVYKRKMEWITEGLGFLLPKLSSRQ